MHRDGVLPQVVRFAVTGVLLTVLAAAIYWTFSLYLMPPSWANLSGCAVATCLGYVLHGRWSFASDAHRDWRTVGRFLVVSSIGLGSNSAFVWLLVDRLSGPVWAPLPAMLFVTPLATFALNRSWVFGLRPSASGKSPTGSRAVEGGATVL